MVRLKVDPWRADMGPGVETAFDDNLHEVTVDCSVESADWSRPLRPEPCRAEPAIFVDGVMRTELRVLASENGLRAWGLLGSYAAGAVLCNGRAAFIEEDEPVGRALILGGRLEASAVRVRVGAHELDYRPHPVAADTPQGLRTGLQRLMLGAEQRLAGRLAEDALVYADGPLRPDFEPRKPVVGVVKRMVVPYLEGDCAALLPHLTPGERTPIFAIGNKVVDRYAWYIRLIERADSWHELSCLARCEVRMSLGLGVARSLADRVACQLPDFAGRPGVDPRAPQNLTPVGALEARLKHRLGSALVITRALQTQLREEAADDR